MILAYMFLLFPSITYGVMYGCFFLAEELTDFGSISMGVVGFVAGFCTLFNPPVMGKFKLLYITGFSSEIGTKLRDWAVGQAGGSCYSRAAVSSNDSKTLYIHPCRGD